MIRKRLQAFVDDVETALRESPEVRAALEQLRDEVERALDALLMPDERRRDERLARALLPLAYLRRLDQDALIAASWLRERCPGQLLDAKDAREVMGELLAALRATGLPPTARG